MVCWARSRCGRRPRARAVHGEEEAFLSPLGVRKLSGIGPVSEEKLLRVGIRTLDSRTPFARGSPLASPRLRARHVLDNDLAIRPYPHDAVHKIPLALQRGDGRSQDA